MIFGEFHICNQIKLMLKHCLCCLLLFPKIVRPVCFDHLFQDRKCCYNVIRKITSICTLSCAIYCSIFWNDFRKNCYFQYHRSIQNLLTKGTKIFENHLNPVMLVFIRKLLPSTLRGVPICQGFQSFCIIL